VTADFRRALENFVIDTANLERLEQEFGRINIFEAIGQANRESRHSDFLAYLLAPSESHGFHDDFLRLFLKRALRELPAETNTISPIELEVWDLEKTVVERERGYIDVLLSNRELKFVVVIENKIHSGEQDGQLASYREFIEQTFSDYRKVYLYLTLEGETPSDPSYIIVSYHTVLDALEQLVRVKQAGGGGDIFVLIDHYLRLVRRRLMVDPELKNLALEIYRKHKDALEFIYECRPDRQNDLRTEIERLIDAQNILEKDNGSKSYILFAVRGWDNLQGMKDGQGWTESGRILLFEFKNMSDRLALNLIIGPGRSDIREQLFKLAQNTKPLFNPASRNLTPRWATIWSKQIIGPKEYEDLDLASAAEKLGEAWNKFVSTDLPKLDGAIRANFTSE
jgi:hypothetical protein